MQHGLFTSSESWILNGNKSHAFQFAKQGYDVWLGNNRGSTYSRKHISLKPDDNDEDAKKYFDFSFYELAKYDLPVMIDFVLN